MEDDSENILGYYIEIGAVEVAGISEEGEFIYSITERARELAPELWDAHEKYIDESLVRLYDMGLMSVTYNENLEATFELTEEGKKVAKELGFVEMDRGNFPND